MTNLDADPRLHVSLETINPSKAWASPFRVAVRRR